MKMKTEFIRGMVSVIIPAYNRRQFIPQTLDSVLSQKYRPIEALLIDDGSTDDTEKVVMRWRDKTIAEKWFELKYLSQSKGGPALARNYGMHESRGEYIQFLDSDDLLSKDKISTQVNALRAKPGYQAAYCKWRTLFDHGILKYSPHYQLMASDSEDIMLRGYISNTWFVPLHSYLFDRKAIIDTGLWDNTVVLQDDTDYLIRMLLQGIRFLYVPGVSVDYRRHLTTHVSGFRRWHSSIKVKEKAYLCLKNYGIVEKYYDEFRLWYQKLINSAAVNGDTVELCERDRSFQQLLTDFSLKPHGGSIKKLITKLAHLNTVRIFRQKIGDCALAWIKKIFRFI